MVVYAIIMSIIAVLCAAGIVFLSIKLSETKRSVEQIAADNLKRGKEEAADFIKLTIDKVQEDKNKINEMSDRELMAEAVLALAGHGRRLDRIEEKLQGIYNYKAYTEGLADQIKAISGMAVSLTENISGSTVAVGGFKQLIETSRNDVEKLNASIANVENIKERIYSLIENINNSVGELETLNNKLATIEGKIQGIYEYKKYLDEIVEQVSKVKALSQALASSITDNDNTVRSFNQTVQNAYNGVNKLNDSLANVESIKERIASVVENMNKSVYEINYLNGKITEIVTTTNGVLQTYGDAPMVKLTNIEAEIRDVREATQRTEGTVSLLTNDVREAAQKTEEAVGSIVDDIQEIIGEGVSGIKGGVSTVKEIVEKALGDEYEYDSLYNKINDVSYNVNSLEDIIEGVKSAVGNIEYGISSSISNVEGKIDDVKSTVDSIETDVSDIKYTVENSRNGY